MNYYRGWDISYVGGRPVTGRWVAKQHGVSMCANTEEMLQSMIDRKILDQIEEKKERLMTIDDWEKRGWHVSMISKGGRKALMIKRTGVFGYRVLRQWVDLEEKNGR